jgi:hypothetical protein
MFYDLSRPYFIGHDVTRSALHLDTLHTTRILRISLHTNVLVII